MRRWVPGGLQALHADKQAWLSAHLPSSLPTAGLPAADPPCRLAFDASPQVDVFALGVILNECFTRRQPWREAHLFQIVL